MIARRLTVDMWLRHATSKFAIANFTYPQKVKRNAAIAWKRFKRFK